MRRCARKKRLKDTPEESSDFYFSTSRRRYAPPCGIVCHHLSHARLVQPYRSTTHLSRSSVRANAAFQRERMHQEAAAAPTLKHNNVPPFFLASNNASRHGRLPCASSASEASSGNVAGKLKPLTDAKAVSGGRGLPAKPRRSPAPRHTDRLSERVNRAFEQSA